MHAKKRNGFSKRDLNKPISSIIVMFCMGVIQSWVVLARGVSGGEWCTFGKFRDVVEK